jgi:radical SAM/Cys-rich protein
MMNEFEEHIASPEQDGLYTCDIDTVQVNVGLRCNQECRHCHLDCSPARVEMMEWPIMQLVVDVARSVRCRIVDITGGAPELNPRIRDFVEALCEAGLAVQMRTNFTVLAKPGMESMPEFLRGHNVHLVGSLPCYLEQNVRAQRGGGVYEKSVDAIRELNSLGYATTPHLPLNLVYNPGGPFLPPDQASLEEAYRQELDKRFGIRFTRLLTITNMPIGRFLSELRRQSRESEYLQLLRDSFNPETLEGLMCRHQISVGWDGTLYDCDFNLALGWPVDHGVADHIRDFAPAALKERRIVTGTHCFGCTAGSGSSCRGALL